MHTLLWWVASIQFSHSVVSDSLWCLGLQYARLPCLSPTPRAWSNSCPYGHDAIIIGDAIQPFHPLSSPSPLAFSHSQHQCLLHIRWPKYWSFSFSISPSNEYSGLVSFRMDWLDLLGVQGTLKSLLRHHSSKASILRCSAFFIVQLSHPYMTTGKIKALTRRTFVDKGPISRASGLDIVKIPWVTVGFSHCFTIYNISEKHSAYHPQIFFLLCVIYKSDCSFCVIAALYPFLWK